MQQYESALREAADCLLEDPTFATKAKKQFFLLKITMLSGRSTVVAAMNRYTTRSILGACHSRLGLARDGTSLGLWHGSDRVPEDAKVRDWPGIKPRGEISEYQLLVTQ
eukprot:4696696-Amphidinium_carterae.1